MKDRKKNLAYHLNSFLSNLLQGMLALVMSSKSISNVMESEIECAQRKDRIREKDAKGQP